MGWRCVYIIRAHSFTKLKAFRIEDDEMHEAITALTEATYCLFFIAILPNIFNLYCTNLYINNPIPPILHLNRNIPPIQAQRQPRQHARIPKQNPHRQHTPHIQSRHRKIDQPRQEIRNQEDRKPIPIERMQHPTRTIPIRLLLAPPARVAALVCLGEEYRLDHAERRDLPAVKGCDPEEIGHVR